MSLIGYIFTTDLQTKKYDWQQWRRIKADVAAKRQDMYDRYADVCAEVGVVNDAEYMDRVKTRPACIKSYFIARSSSQLMNPMFDTLFSSMVPMYENCANYSESDYRPGYCMNHNCPIRRRNHMYHLAQEEYSHALAQRRTFWPKKFQWVR